MDYCEIEIKANGKVIRTISNIEIYQIIEQEKHIRTLSLRDLQARVSYQIYGYYSEFDNLCEIEEFINKWVYNAFICCLTKNYYKKYNGVSL